MALRIAFAAQAAQDLRETVEFISVDSPIAADVVRSRVEKSLRLLAERPYMGHPAPETGQADMRRMSVPPYVVFYRIGESAVEIARILHSSRFFALSRRQGPFRRPMIPFIRR